MMVPHLQQLPDKLSLNLFRNWFSCHCAKSVIMVDLFAYVSIDDFCCMPSLRFNLMLQPHIDRRDQMGRVSA